MTDFPEILTNSRFYLELKLNGSKDSVDGLFMGCSGFKATHDVIEIAEVTSQMWGLKGASAGRLISTKVPGDMKYSNITLRRGLTASTVFWDWIEANPNLEESCHAKERKAKLFPLFSTSNNSNLTQIFRYAQNDNLYFGKIGILPNTSNFSTNASQTSLTPSPTGELSFTKYQTSATNILRA